MEEPGTTQRGHDHELVEEALAGLAMLLIRGVKASPDPAAAAQVAGAGLRALGDWVEQTAADVAGKDAGASAGLVEWPPVPQGGAAEMAPAVRQPFLLIDDEDEAPAADATVDAAVGSVDSGSVADLKVPVSSDEVPVPEREVPIPEMMVSEALVAVADPAVAVAAGEESGKSGVMETAFPPVAAVPVSGVVPDAPGLAPFPLSAVLGESGGTDPAARPLPGLEAVAQPSAEGVASADAVVSGADDAGIAEPAVALSADVVPVAGEEPAVAVTQVSAVPVLEKLPASAGPRVSGEWVTSPSPADPVGEPGVKRLSGMVRMLVGLAVLAALAWGLRAIVLHFFSALFSA